MALRVQAANRPVLDADGFFHGAIVAIKPIASTDKYKAPRFRWTIEGKGTVRLIGFHFTTPSELAEVLSDAELELYEETTSGHDVEPDVVDDEIAPPTYNALAHVCLALELVTPVDLDVHLIAKTIEKLDLDAAKGLAVKCKLAKRTMTLQEGSIERKVPFIAPILETLTLDK